MAMEDCQLNEGELSDVSDISHVSVFKILTNILGGRKMLVSYFLILEWKYFKHIWTAMHGT